MPSKPIPEFRGYFDRVGNPICSECGLRTSSDPTRVHVHSKTPSNYFRKLKHQHEQIIAKLLNGQQRRLQSLAHEQRRIEKSLKQSTDARGLS